MENKQRVPTSVLKNNFSKYAKQVQETGQPIDITLRGVVILTLSPPEKPDKAAMLESLVGIIPDEGQSVESEREEMRGEKYGLDA